MLVLLLLLLLHMQQSQRCSFDGRPFLTVFVNLQKTAKRCPVCGMAIEKAQGCNKMTCGNCGAFFCWRCNKRVEGYEHFRNGTCILFEQADINAWHVQWAVQMERCAIKPLPITS